MQKVAATLSGAGYDILAISPRYPADSMHRRVGRVESWHYPCPSLPDGIIWHLLEYTYSLVSIGLFSIAGLITRRFSIVHFCSPPDILFPLAALFRILGRSVIVDVHDLSPELARVRYELDEKTPLVRLIALVERLMLNCANSLITTTKAQQDVLIERTRIPKERFSIVRNGIDLAIVPGAAARAGEHPTVGYVGTMNPQDGIDILLHAIHHIRYVKRREDIRFMLIGDGGSYEPLKKLAAELEIEEVTTFTGRLKPRDALSRLASCDVCVQPDPQNAFNDTCSMVKMLEYMALAKPIVAFELRETRECCGDAAVYAQGNSPVDFGEKIVALVDDPAKQRRLGDDARRRLEKSYTWERSERELLRVYGELA